MRSTERQCVFTFDCVGGSLADLIVGYAKGFEISSVSHFQYDRETSRPGWISVLVVFKGPAREIERHEKWLAENLT